MVSFWLEDYFQVESEKWHLFGINILRIWKLYWPNWASDPWFILPRPFRNLPGQAPMSNPDNQTMRPSHLRDKISIKFFGLHQVTSDLLLSLLPTSFTFLAPFFPFSFICWDFLGLILARKVFGKTVVIIVFKIRFMEVQLSGGKRISLEFLHQL